jgi:ribosomal protein S18 acetylase RimI-like enzyme
LFRRLRGMRAIKRALDEDPVANGILVERLFFSRQGYSVYGDGERFVAVKGRSVLFAGDWEGAEVPRHLLPTPNFWTSAAPWAIFEGFRRTHVMAWKAPCWLLAAPRPRRPAGGWEDLEPLTVRDAPEVARFWHLADNPLPHIRQCIRKYPSVCIRIDGKLAAWGGNHFTTDKAAELGFAHTKRRFRRQGLGRRITVDLTHKLYDMGLAPYCYIFKDNAASLGMVEGLGFKRRGDVAWFGTRRPRKRPYRKR